MARLWDRLLGRNNTDRTASRDALDDLHEEPRCDEPPVRDDATGLRVVSRDDATEARATFHDSGDAYALSPLKMTDARRQVIDQLEAESRARRAAQ